MDVRIAEFYCASCHRTTLFPYWKVERYCFWCSPQRRGEGR
jgi:hypothetical protein